MTRICFDARAVHPGMTGIGQYAWSLVAALRSCGGRHEYVLLKTPGHDALGNSFPANWQLVDVHGTGAMWNQLQLPGLLQEWEADIYHTPLFVAPIVRVCRGIMTLHDVIPLTHPHLTSASFQEFFHHWVGPSLRACDAVVTTSQAAKVAILEHLDVGDKPVCVVHQAVGERFRPRRDDELAPALGRRVLRVRRYMLYVGAIDRRKNIEGLLRAYALSNALKEFGVRLALCGSSADGEYTVEQAMHNVGVREGVQDLGYVPDAELPLLVAGARAFVFPSLAEGFGRPVLEALASGVPVVASDIPSLREVADDAAELVDPQSVASITEGIQTVLSEGGEASGARREAGLARVASFSPERFAREVLAVYEVVEGN